MTVDAWPATGQASQAAALEQVGALFDLHYRPLCRLAYVLLGDPARAEDVVQEAFLRTFAGWGRLRQPALAPLYLRRAVLNQCRSVMRRRVTETRGNLALVAGQRGADAGGFDAKEALRLDVTEAVRDLPSRQRDTVVLRYFLDLGEAEVAATLGVSVGTVKSQLSKARRSLAANTNIEEVDRDG